VIAPSLTLSDTTMVSALPRICHSRVAPSAVVDYDVTTSLSVFNVEERFTIDEVAANRALGFDNLNQSTADSHFPYIYWNGSESGFTKVRQLLQTMHSITINPFRLARSFLM